MAAAPSKREIRVGGIDPSASRRRPSGVAVVEGDTIVPGLARSDEDIAAWMGGAKVVAIDAPLSLPASPRLWRDADKAILLMGYRLLPPTWGSMRALTLRARRLVLVLRDKGVGEVVETHPRSALLNTGCRGLGELVALMGLGLDRPEETLSRDERDAVIAALVAYNYYSGEKTCIARVDGEICLLPRLCRKT